MVIKKYLLVGILPFLLVACDPMAPIPTPIAVVVSPLPTLSPTPRPTNTPIPINTPAPTPTTVLLPSNTPFPCNSDTGQIAEVNNFISTTGRGENLRYDVYLPPCYFELNVRFPLLILLHGLSYREEQWQDIGTITTLEQGIRMGVLPPMIIVMPYMGNLGTINSFPPNNSYETYLMDELLPALQSDLCIWENRNYRAIGGISRGGFWAMSVAMRFPDIFGIAGAHSGVFPSSLRDVPALFNPYEIASNSAILPESNLKIYLDNAAPDPARGSNEDLSSRLATRQIAHTYVINTLGGHDNAYWSSHISEYLAFYGKDWARGYDGYPSCSEPSP